MTTENGEWTPNPSPRPHPRVKPEAELNADRNRGGAEKWYEYSNTDGFEYNKPHGRMVTAEGERNAQMNKGTMSDIMGGYADPPMERKIHPRGVSGQASEIASQNKGEGIKNLIDNYGNLGLSERPAPKVHGDNAEEYAERNKGTVDNLMNNYGTLTPDERPAPKVNLGGVEVAEKHVGAGMGPLLRMEGELTPDEPKIGKLHQRSQGPGWDEDPPAYRMRPEAEDIADKYATQTNGASALLHGEAEPPTIRDPKPVAPHMRIAETPRPVTSPMRTRPEAMQYYTKNQSSEMSAIMHGDTNASSAPHKRHNRMMQRSEDW